ncbi:TetR/AcrR family transcriptional regulator [Thiomicrorhabdus sediminis]|uniref:TetR/AcrR family transcriptional regulator n=1 Tax=Thiomicrorhabdus sediminis TaxID=2580412 RepID=A0A4P9K695_9GAMM|nr:TetR/AcrR family transcriptional regulator [Thiomicrorhabdus sediminis]QCU90555.1 TetR/AcrR family transcriptional regulator [Thiomicrorhabdus sediminis]
MTTALSAQEPQSKNRQSKSSTADTTRGNKTVQPSTKRGVARQQKILEIAEQQFLQYGYSGSSVNEIMRLSGGSLGTLYRQFGNKLGLFEAVFKKKSKELFQPFETETHWPEEFGEGLYHFGKTMQDIALSADGIAIYRLVITENNIDQSKIQKIFYRYGPTIAIDVLAKYLDKHIANTRLPEFNSELYAQQFLEMIKGPFLLKALLGEEITDKERELALSQAVDLFCNSLQKR